MRARVLCKERVGREEDVDGPLVEKEEGEEGWMDKRTVDGYTNTTMRD